MIIVNTGSYPSYPAGISISGLKKVPRMLMGDNNLYVLNSVGGSIASYSMLKVGNPESHQEMVDHLQPRMNARAFKFYKISQPVSFIDEIQKKEITELKFVNLMSLVFDMSVIELYLHYNKLATHAGGENDINKIYLSKVREWVASPFRLSSLIDKYEKDLEASLVEVIL